MSAQVLSLKEVRALTLEKLSESGIENGDLKKLGIKPLIAGQTNKLIGIDRPAIYIPYSNFKHSKSSYYRVRLLGGHTGFGKGPPKYLQPKDSRPAFYFPPIIDWEEIAQDPEVPLYLTEGEFKSICGCKFDYPTIGLGGVYSWRSKKEKLPALPDFNFVNWSRRVVYIVFDSDINDNPMVLAAALQLSRHLITLGAQPHIVSLPAGPNGEKMGLDDFLMQRPPEEFDALVDDAAPFSQAETLWTFNEELAFIVDPGIVLRMSDGGIMSAGDFKNHIYANRYYYEYNHKSDRLEKKQAAPAWIKWEQRHQLNKIVYLPGQERIVANCYNAWQGWGCVPKKGSVAPWNELLKFVFEEDKAARHWFEQWCAYQFQHPGTKLFSAVLMWSVHQGTGKTLIGETLKRIFGPNGKKIDQAQLHSPFNGWAVYTQFVLGDEISGSDKRADSDRLKNIITQAEVTVNKKYVPEFTLPDTINYYFTSNHPDALFLEDTDRRTFIQEIRGAPLSDDFYKNYNHWLYKAGGDAALFHYLLNYDLRGFNPNGKAYITDAKHEMVTITKSALGFWVRELLAFPDEFLRVGDRTMALDLYSAKQILALYESSEGNSNVTINGMARELRRAGAIPLKPLAHEGRTLKLYALRNQDKWLKAKPTTIKTHLKNSIKKEKAKKY